MIIISQRPDDLFNQREGIYFVNWYAANAAFHWLFYRQGLNGYDWLPAEHRLAEPLLYRGVVGDLKGTRSIF